jgi:hypothetical protein
LALAVLGMLWLIALKPLQGGPEPGAKPKFPLDFVYLQILMVLILAHFFTAHGGSIRPGPTERSPLGLPRGSVRFLLLGGYLALTYYLWRKHKELDFEVKGELQGDVMLLVGLVVSAFLLGHIITGIVRKFSGNQLPFWFQDFEAWIALLALLALGALLLWQLVINTALPADKQRDLPVLNAVLAALVGFYFGARS